MDVPRGMAAPSEASSQTKVASSDGIEREVSIEKVTNAIFSVLPEITPLIFNLTKRLDDRQLNTLETTVRLIIPITRAILKTQDGITQKEEGLLHDVEGYLGALISLLQERGKKVDTLQKSAGEPIPDYTDTLDDTELSPKPVQEPDASVPGRKEQTPSKSNQRQLEDSVFFSPVTFDRKIKNNSPQPYERKEVERKQLGRSFFALPGVK